MLDPRRRALREANPTPPDGPGGQPPPPLLCSARQAAAGSSGGHTERSPAGIAASLRDAPGPGGGAGRRAADRGQPEPR